jgi:hypothetical protein
VHGCILHGVPAATPHTNLSNPPLCVISRRFDKWLVGVKIWSWTELSLTLCRGYLLTTHLD